MQTIRISAYRNLHKPGVQYSIKLKGKVVDYQTTVIMRECCMKHATGKQLERVTSGAREVCQWINGNVNVYEPHEPVPDHDVSPDADWRRLNCDPKKGIVCDSETGDRIDVASVVMLNEEGAFYA